MRRSLSVACAVVSLLVFVATCVLWVRSYRVPENRVAGRDRLNITHREPLYWLISGRGHLSLCRQSGKNWDNDLTGYNLAGARFGGHWGTDGSLLWNLDVPYWMLAAATAVPVCLSLWRWRRRWRAWRNARRGFCPRCGYDLCASPARCPECGWGATAVPP